MRVRFTFANSQGCVTALECGGPNYRYTIRNPPIKHPGVMGDPQVLGKIAVLQCHHKRCDWRAGGIEARRDRAENGSAQLWIKYLEREPQSVSLLGNNLQLS